MANQPHTLFVSLLLDVKERRRAEVVIGDIFTSCQGAIFLLKEQNSFLIQSRCLGAVKVDTLLKYMASDKTKRRFLCEQSSQKDYSAFIWGRLYNIKDRSRIMSCDCKSHVWEKDVGMCHFNQERAGGKGICLLPCQGEICFLLQHPCCPSADIGLNWQVLLLFLGLLRRGRAHCSFWSAAKPGCKTTDWALQCSEIKAISN